ESDDIVAHRTLSLSVAERFESGRSRYEGSVQLRYSGPFGYSVRVLPAHRLLANHAELGLVAVPSAPSGMTDGPVR
ncbi:MAG TPA: hypothetical protein VMZ00_02335, partial [Sporichthya sp.]|nr:hypothetical protein [Sporichthya sp.]